MFHKGYDIREPIGVRVLPDRIGEFLKELHLTEGRNTGFQKIIRALKANGSPMPIFETDDERTCFLTTIPIHLEFTASNEAVNVDLTDHEKQVRNAMKMDAAITTPKMAELQYRIFASE